MSRISIEGWNVPLLNNHLYLVYKNDAGQEYVIRGGPTINNGVFDRLFVLYNDVKLEESPDARPAGVTAEDRGAKIIYEGSYAADLWNIMKQHASNIHANQFEYSSLILNSNSAVASILNSVGININNNLPDAPGIDFYPGIINLIPFSTNLTGSNQIDTLVGGDGDDALSGGIGNDFIYGDHLFFTNIPFFTHNDVLYGEAGNDSVVADIGNDYVVGGLDSDTILGSDGIDTIYGDNDTGSFTVGSADSIDAGADNDSVYGEGGNDTILGGGGIDYIEGGAGEDSIDGGGENDVILVYSRDRFGNTIADSSNNNVDGGDGDDNIFGSLGMDILIKKQPKNIIGF